MPKPWEYRDFYEQLEQARGKSIPERDGSAFSPEELRARNFMPPVPFRPPPQEPGPPPPPPPPNPMYPEGFEGVLSSLRRFLTGGPGSPIEERLGGIPERFGQGVTEVQEQAGRPIRSPLDILRQAMPSLRFAGDVAGRALGTTVLPGGMIGPAPFQAGLGAIGRATEEVLPSEEETRAGRERIRALPLGERLRELPSAAAESLGRAGEAVRRAGEYFETPEEREKSREAFLKAQEQLPGYWGVVTSAATELADPIWLAFGALGGAAIKARRVTGSVASLRQAVERADDVVQIPRSVYRPFERQLDEALGQAKSATRKEHVAQTFRSWLDYGARTSRQALENAIKAKERASDILIQTYRNVLPEEALEDAVARSGRATALERLGNRWLFAPSARALADSLLYDTMWFLQSVTGHRRPDEAVTLVGRIISDPWAVRREVPLVLSERGARVVMFLRRVAHAARTTADDAAVTGVETAQRFRFESTRLADAIAQALMDASQWGRVARDLEWHAKLSPRALYPLAVPNRVQRFLAGIKSVANPAFLGTFRWLYRNWGNYATTSVADGHMPLTSMREVAEILTRWGHTAERGSEVSRAAMRGFSSAELGAVLRESGAWRDFLPRGGESFWRWVWRQRETVLRLGGQWERGQRMQIHARSIQRVFPRMMSSLAEELPVYQGLDPARRRALRSHFAASLNGEELMDAARLDRIVAADGSGRPWNVPDTSVLREVLDEYGLANALERELPRARTPEEARQIGQTIIDRIPEYVSRVRRLVGQVPSKVRQHLDDMPSPAALDSRVTAAEGEVWMHENTRLMLDTWRVLREAVEDSIGTDPNAWLRARQLEAQWLDYGGTGGATVARKRLQDWIEANWKLIENEMGPTAARQFYHDFARETWEEVVVRPRAELAARMAREFGLEPQELPLVRRFLGGRQPALGVEVAMEEAGRARVSDASWQQAGELMEAMREAFPPDAMWIVARRFWTKYVNNDPATLPFNRRAMARAIEAGDTDIAKFREGVLRRTPKQKAVNELAVARASVADLEVELESLAAGDLGDEFYNAVVRSLLNQKTGTIKQVRKRHPRTGRSFWEPADQVSQIVKRGDELLMDWGERLRGRPLTDEELLGLAREQWGLRHTKAPDLRRQLASQRKAVEGLRATVGSEAEVYAAEMAPDVSRLLDEAADIGVADVYQEMVRRGMTPEEIRARFESVFPGLSRREMEEFLRRLPEVPVRGRRAEAASLFPEDFETPIDQVEAAQHMARILEDEAWVVVDDFVRNLQRVIGGDASLRERLERELAEVAIPQMDNAKVLADDIARQMGDQILLNYEDTNWLNNYLWYLYPWHYWTVKSAANWVRRFVEHPNYLASYAAKNEMLERLNDDPSIPDWQKHNVFFALPGGRRWSANPDMLFIPFWGVQWSWQAYRNATTPGGKLVAAASIPFAMHPGTEIGAQLLYGAVEGRGREGREISLETLKRRWKEDFPFLFREFASSIPGPMPFSPMVLASLAGLARVPDYLVGPLEYLRTPYENSAARAMLMEWVGEGRYSQEQADAALRQKEKNPLWLQALRESQRLEGVRRLTGIGLGMQVYPTYGGGAQIISQRIRDYYQQPPRERDSEFWDKLRAEFPHMPDRYFDAYRSEFERERRRAEGLEYEIDRMERAEKALEVPMDFAGMSELKGFQVERRNERFMREAMQGVRQWQPIETDEELRRETETALFLIMGALQPQPEQFPGEGGEPDWVSWQEAYDRYWKEVEGQVSSSDAYKGAYEELSDRAGKPAPLKQTLRRIANRDAYDQWRRANDTLPEAFQEVFREREREGEREVVGLIRDGDATAIVRLLRGLDMSGASLIPKVQQMYADRFEKDAKPGGRGEFIEESLRDIASRMDFEVRARKMFFGAMDDAYPRYSEYADTYYELGGTARRRFMDRLRAEGHWFPKALELWFQVRDALEGEEETEAPEGVPDFTFTFELPGGETFEVGK